MPTPKKTPENPENMTTKQDSGKKFPYINPTGKGGFGEHPENRSDGRWDELDSISYQYKLLIRKKVEDFKRWLQDNPEDERTIAQELAHNAVAKAREDLKYLVEVTDRTEGTSVRKHELRSKGGGPLVIIKDDGDKINQMADESLER